MTSKRIRRRALSTALALAWVLGPALPALSCSLVQAIAESNVAGDAPDCHRSAVATPAPETASGHGSPPRACCADVTTSCCLATLDVEGAVFAAPGPDTPATTAVLIPVVALSIPSSTRIAPAIDAFIEFPPLERTSRILRL